VTFGARALIRLGALKHNLTVIRKSCPDAKIMAVIKANAYGHGLLPVAQSLPDADALAVARLSEAMLLRDAGIRTPIVLLAGVLTAEELRAAIEREIDIVVHCHEQLALLETCAKGRTSVWLKFDTGMNRLGFDPQQAPTLISRVQACAAVRQLRLMSHLASADETDNPATAAQLQVFRHLVADFRGEISIANSPGALGWPELAGPHWVRTGIALFGISPFAGQTGAQLGLKPVMQFEARLVAVKMLRQGARVGYKGSYTAPADSKFGIISAGYGDGYTRQFRSGTPVLLNGRRVPLIGHVSMDMIAVDLGPEAHDQLGDVATLWGPKLPVEEVAPWAGAIPYELVCGVMNREASEIVD